MLEGFLEQATLPKVLLGLLFLRFFYQAVKTTVTSQKVKKLGAHAPVRPTYLPYGFDLVIPMLRYALKDQSYEWWSKRMLGTYGKGRYTIEFGVGQRIIMTADPENIKAILATQFKDYGKGEEFRKDWYHFLGNGACHSLV